VGLRSNREPLRPTAIEYGDSVMFGDCLCRPSRARPCWWEPGPGAGARRAATWLTSSVSSMLIVWLHPALVLPSTFSAGCTGYHLPRPLLNHMTTPWARIICCESYLRHARGYLWRTPVECRCGTSSHETSEQGPTARPQAPLIVQWRISVDYGCGKLISRETHQRKDQFLALKNHCWHCS
jgi:hypothetical protein